MSLRGYFIGRTDFSPESDIRDLVRESKHFDEQLENVNGAEMLLFFSTSTQQTWLVSTEERLYCILDDVEKDTPHLNWSIPKDQLVSGNEIPIQFSSRDKSAKTGLVDIGPKHKNWLYTKQLFSQTPIEVAITNVIKKKMT